MWKRTEKWSTVPFWKVQPHIRLTYVDGEWQVTKGDQATIRVGSASKRFDLNGDGEETVSDLAVCITG